MKKLLVLIMLATFAFACTDGIEDKPITEQSEKPNTMKGISLAKVNNTSITAEDLREEFNMLNPQAQQMFMTEGGFEDLLDELIKKELLYQEALKKNYTSEDEFKEIIEDYKKRVLIGFLLREEVEKKSQVTEDEIKKYYDENKKDFLLEAPEKGQPTVVDFDSVKNLIRSHLETQKQSELFDSYISNLKEQSNIEIDKNAFGATFGNITAPSEKQESPEQGLQKQGE